VAVVPLLLPVLLLLLLAVDDPVAPGSNPIFHLPTHYAQSRCN
jgi:hypothetical protein